MSNNSEQNEKRDPFDGEYIGNIFGPKLTLYALLFLLFFIGLAVYRHWSLGVGPGFVPLEEADETLPRDSDTILLRNSSD